jgi:hypothetical protein
MGEKHISNKKTIIENKPIINNNITSNIFSTITYNVKEKYFNTFKILVFIKKLFDSNLNKKPFIKYWKMLDISNILFL